MFRNVCLCVSLFLVSCGDVKDLKYQPKGREKTADVKEPKDEESTWAEKFAEEEYLKSLEAEVSELSAKKDAEASESVASDDGDGAETSDSVVSDDTEAEKDPFDEALEDDGKEEQDPYDAALADDTETEKDPFDEALENEGQADVDSDTKSLVDRKTTGIPTLGIKDFKGDKVKEEDGSYYTYYYSYGSYTVILALNSYEQLKKRIKKKPKALLLAKQDYRVVQDLVLDKKSAYLLQVPLLAYEDLSQSLHDVHAEEQQKELELFREFKKKVGTFSNYSKAYKSKEFWDSVEQLAKESKSCMNYKALLSWRKKKNPRAYSFVASFEKLVDYNEYFDGLFVFSGSYLKDYHFEQFKSYKEIGKKLRSLKVFRSKLDRGVLAMVKYVNDYGELVQRFDAQWGRRAKLLSDIRKLREAGRASRRDINQLVLKAQSIDRLLNQMGPDIAKMNRGMKKYVNKYVNRLNKRNKIK